MLRKCLYIVMILSCSKADENDSYLEAPQLYSVTSIEPPGLYIHWRPVKYLMRNPILGYKIRIYEITESPEREAKLINKQPRYMENDTPVQQFHSNKIDPTIEIITGVNVKATVTDLKYNTIYEVRVLAFRSSVDGPPSDPVRIKLLKDTEYNAAISRSVNGCHLSVHEENVQIGEDIFQLIDNSYF
ncbi:uncharacterized protein LOC119828156 [Zerene cesonia]|uniref:uncharacterized protein LOC119828156 n=1 Tax=Zerene cesonia TaxID=33412 RepID=UPI0018E5639C|nr:uncharacterized protein LOC119828156 [Zerene cesonia]